MAEGLVVEATHLVAHLLREIESAIRDVLLPHDHMPPKGKGKHRQALESVKTGDRQESCSAAELRRDRRPSSRRPLRSDTGDDQKEFFREVDDEDGDFRLGRGLVDKSVDFKTPANIVVADATPERRFVREPTSHENSLKIDAWLKNAPMGFYSIEYHGRR